MKAQACLLSLGSVNLDFEMRVERWPQPGEALPGRDFAAAGGGKAANVAFCARKLEAPSVLLARMGDDVFGGMALGSLERVGVDLRHVRRIAGETTGVALIVVRPDGEKAILLADNANVRWKAEDLRALEAALRDAADGSVLVADLEVPAEVVRSAARACRARGFKVVLDPSPVRRMEPDLYSLCHCITPNPGEASALVGFPVRSIDEALRAGQALRERGTGTALMKLPDGGCVIVGESGAELIRTPEVDAVDKTGAGDAFASALGVGILAGQAIGEAARLAVAASTAAVTRYGTQASYSDRRELERLLAHVETHRLDRETPQASLERLT